MDFETVSAEEFGASLRGIGLNLLVTDVLASANFLQQVFGMQIFRQSADFAIIRYGDQLFQLHADGTYHSNPYQALLPENSPRGAGIEIRLYDTDPDVSVLTAADLGATILQPPTDKPHGLRESYILDRDGYAWVPSKPIV